MQNENEIQIDARQVDSKVLKPSQKKAVKPVAMDPASKQLLALAKQVANSDVSVLISGESGVGKEVVARYIHDNSARKDKPFVAINCAAIPDNMLEATLFGYEKGAFTGAIKGHTGKFEQAQQGTLLLDEVSEMPLSLQVKLLRVLQEREVEPLGSHKTIQLNVRIIATTNRDLQQEVEKGNFRKDLYYRLNIFPIHWVPLRERPLDIVPLAEYLLAHHAHLMKRNMPTISQQAQTRLLTHLWPGNAREMDNVMQRALILSSEDELQAEFFKMDAIPDERAQPKVENHSSSTASRGLKEQEYELILNTLKETSGNRSMAAKKLNVSPRTLRYKLARMREKGFSVPPRTRGPASKKIMEELI